MNWDALSAVSQLIGSLAVVLSVLYLAVQVHQSTRVAKLAMQDAAATALRDVTKPLMENAELERIWRVGLEDISALSIEERARFFHAVYQFLKAFETIHFHYVYGMMDRDLWEGWHGLLRHYVVAPGMAHYWKLRPEVFSERFRNFVNSLQPPTINARWARSSKRDEANGEREHFVASSGCCRMTSRGLQEHEV